MRAYLCRFGPKPMKKARLTIEEMQDLARSRGGLCLSDTYVNNRVRLLWQCGNGHQWHASPGSVKNGGHWCPICAGQGRPTIEDMVRIAGNRGGRCLSERYVNDGTKLSWECAKGHRWETSPNMVKRGRWCPTCGKATRAKKRMLTISDMQRLASSRCGKCLSSEYAGVHQKLMWECGKGHRWEAKPTKIKGGTWCPHCAGVAPSDVTIEAMQRIAKERGGVCLSERYVAAHKKLHWECACRRLQDHAFRPGKASNCE